MTQTLTTERMAEIAKLAIRLQRISNCAAVTSSGETVLHHTHVDEILSALHDVTAELLANREAQPVQAPFMYAICNPDGSAWLDENCVAGTAEELKPVLSDLRRDTGDGFCIVPLYTAPPAPAVASGENCWSCGKFFTYAQHSESDGYCPHCNAPVDLNEEESDDEC